MEAKLDLILEKLKTIDTLEIKLREQHEKIACMATKIENIQITNDTLLKMQNDVIDLKMEVNVANSNIRRLDSEVEILHRKKADKQLIIDNVPYLQNESLPHLLHSILSALICKDIETSFPVDAYRLGKYDSTKTRPPAILVEFNSPFLRKNVYTHMRQKMLLSDEICPARNNFGNPPKERLPIYVKKIIHLQSIRYSKKPGS
jgi:hypothetical protein